MNELQAIAQWLYSTLSGDAGIAAAVGNRVYERVAPQGAAYPFVLFSTRYAEDRNGIGPGARLFTRPLYRIVAHAEGGGFGAVDSIAAVIDAVMEGAEGSVALAGTSYHIGVVRRERAYRDVELLPGGRLVFVAGGEYRLRCVGTGA